MTSFVPPTLPLLTTTSSPFSLPNAPSRTRLQDRPLFFRTNVLFSSTSSAFVERGHTRLFCSLFGPRPQGAQNRSIQTHPHEASLMIDCRMAGTCQRERTTSARSRHMSDTERVISQRVYDALLPSLFLEIYPKCSVDIYFLILDHDGGLFDSLLLAAALALGESGMELRYLVVGASVSLFKRVQDGPQTRLPDQSGKDDVEEAVWNDCDLNELNSPAHMSTLSIAYDPLKEEFASLSITGQVEEKALHEMLALATAQCHTTLQIVKTHLREQTLLQIKCQEETATHVKR